MSLAGGRNFPWKAMMKLVVVTKAGGIPGRTHEDVVVASLEGGCKAIQLRDKEMSDREFTQVAERIAKKCRKEEALFFVNDRVDVALAVGADGVHLGVEDLEVKRAREILPREA
ncbi:MAG: thiamine phosphate synthase, partial [Actinomycetota bacterium]|nr:thiamine phosphate synthase [Actinomycetota bacterium]